MRSFLGNSGLRRLSTRSYTCTKHANRFLTSSTTLNPVEASDYEYCMNQVKTYDYEGYLQILLFPKPLQRPLAAIRAFNVEMATMKEQLPNNAFSLASRTRFQFWRDILHQCQETQAKVQAEGITAPDSTIVNIPQQPLARELYASIQGYNLNVRWFERILEARQMDMTRKLSYASYSELEDYAEMSYSSLNYLILELLGLQDDQKLNFVASHLGVCTGLVNLLRGFPWHLQQRVCHVPQDLLEKLNLTEEKLFSLSLENADDREKLFATVHDMASQAYAHLGQVRQLYNEHIAENKNGISQGDQVFLVFPLVTCEVYLDYLLKCDFDPYEASTESIYTSPLYYQYKLLKLKFLKKI